MYLVTGAGGSIGSAICKATVRKVIAVGHGENSLYNLKHATHKEVADIRDYRRMEEIIIKYEPNAIFHAAAHKHVGFCEDNVNDAISNNITGTQNLVRLAKLHRTERFVLVSTDKAVEPTSVMGMTKALAEKVVLDAGFTVVKLGNVAWSRGSVLPLWKKQIANGDPVTLTDPRATRYFISRKDAALAILGATGNRVVIPEMNRYRMIDIARGMGATKADIIGLQKGEKLHEKLRWEE